MEKGIEIYSHGFQKCCDNDTIHSKVRRFGEEYMSRMSNILLFQCYCFRGDRMHYSVMQ